MSGFKRNQLEHAIHGIKGGERPHLVNEIRRLLDADRGLDPEPRRKFQYAFFSHEASGSGNEIWFSEYEVFAVVLALNLLHHGFPQQTCVEVLRSVRTSLQREHGRIVRRPPESPFDLQAAAAAAKAGDIAVTMANPVFLIIVYASARRGQEGTVQRTALLHGAQEVMRFMTSMTPGEACTAMEIASLTQSVHTQLQKTEPSRRGRPGRPKKQK